MICLKKHFRILQTRNNLEDNQVFLNFQDPADQRSGKRVIIVVVVVVIVADAVAVLQDLMKYFRILQTRELANEYSFQEDDGSLPPDMR